MNTDDFSRSVHRVLHSEDHRAQTTGFGTTKQGLALARQYREQLADKIAADRADARDKVVWRALKDIDVDTLALRLLVAGITASGDLGADENGERNFRDTALWIGRNLGQHREIGLKVGAWGTNMLLALPIFGLDGDVLRLTAAADELMDDVLERAVRDNPLLSPLTTPPEDWTQVRKGGLPPNHWAGVSLIRERHPSIEAAARKAIGVGRMQPVLDAINALQRVPFAINEPVLDFMLRTGGPSVPGPKPPVWQREKYQRFQTELAKLTAWHTDLVTAEAMVAAGRFWLPLWLDFRGRVYAVSHFNFQREDHVRGLFLFADGEPIGEEGLRWLKCHVAKRANGNTWSDVKRPGDLGFEDRIAWTDANLEILRGIGEAVLHGDATLPSESPKDRCQFLAACVELVQALDVGPDFRTRLPLTFDGCCSGLQHLCAMTRAEEGRYVNLTANEKRDYFYTRVASRVWEVAPHLRPLMMDKSDREIVKRPAMSYFYGSRPGGFPPPKNGRFPPPMGMTAQILEVLKERKKNDYAGAKDLAHKIFTTIEDMVPLARDARNLVRRCAWLLAKVNKPLRYTSALGFPIISQYHDPIIERISVYLNGRRRRVNLAVGDETDIRRHKAANAAPANFVHSVDAAHLQLTSLATAKEGIDL